MAVRVSVEIGELVLHGFPPGDRFAVGDAVRAELARLFERDGVPETWAGGDRVDAGQVTAGATPAGTGTAIARAVHAGIAGPGTAGEARG